MLPILLKHRAVSYTSATGCCVFETQFLLKLQTRQPHSLIGEPGSAKPHVWRGVRIANSPALRNHFHLPLERCIPKKHTFASVYVRTIDDDGAIAFIPQGETNSICHGPDLGSFYAAEVANRHITSRDAFADDVRDRHVRSMVQSSPVTTIKNASSF